MTELTDREKFEIQNIKNAFSDTITKIVQELTAKERKLAGMFAPNFCFHLQIHRSGLSARLIKVPMGSDPADSNSLPEYNYVVIQVPQDCRTTVFVVAFLLPGEDILKTGTPAQQYRTLGPDFEQGIEDISAFFTKTSYPKQMLQ